MKFKSLTAIIFGAIILSSSLCFAEVDGSKILLGGISPGMSETDFINAFGQPTRKDGDDWTYKNFEVEVKGGIVKEVSTRSELITAGDGIRVGLAAEALNTTFGKADKVDIEHDGIEYKYYSTDRTKKIEFKVVNGIISKITCEIND
ncbi:MAG: hypothetical protein IKT98_04375 [Selenomonadaceae bacterium]|nr:hypothetical protein [Selenomonadaceae bacterium]